MATSTQRHLFKIAFAEKSRVGTSTWGCSTVLLLGFAHDCPISKYIAIENNLEHNHYDPSLLEYIAIESNTFQSKYTAPLELI